MLFDFYLKENPTEFYSTEDVGNKQEANEYAKEYNLIVKVHKF